MISFESSDIPSGHCMCRFVHWLGKPIEQVQQEQRIVIMPPLAEREVEVVTEEQEALPEAEE